MLPEHHQFVQFRLLQPACAAPKLLDGQAPSLIDPKARVLRQHVLRIAVSRVHRKGDLLRRRRSTAGAGCDSDGSALKGTPTDHENGMPTGVRNAEVGIVHPPDLSNGRGAGAEKLAEELSNQGLAGVSRAGATDHGTFLRHVLPRQSDSPLPPPAKDIAKRNSSPYPFSLPWSNNAQHRTSLSPPYRQICILSPASPLRAAPELVPHGPSPCARRSALLSSANERLTSVSTTVWRSGCSASTPESSTTTVTSRQIGGSRKRICSRTPSTLARPLPYEAQTTRGRLLKRPRMLDPGSSPLTPV